MQLRIIQEDERRGIHIDWARGGRAGMMLWDDSGCWRGMAEKIETVVYGGLTTEQMSTLETQPPTSFSGPEEAIAWGVEQGAFRDAVHAKNAYDKVKNNANPKQRPTCGACGSRMSKRVNQSARNIQSRNRLRSNSSARGCRVIATTTPGHPLG